MSLRFEDPLHGVMAFDEPVLCALIESAPMQRIRDVDMGAYARGFYPGVSFSRFEHSLGVSYLLQRAGASIEEQIHGLLHDVNHTAFSHAIDYVLKAGSEDAQSYQDDTFEGFVRSSCLPRILEGHGFDTAYIIDERQFPLEEQPLPALCADRLDYGLRSLFHYGLMPAEEVRAMLAELQSDGRAWYFSSRRAAADFGQAFATLDNSIFDSLRAGVMYRSIGDCVGYALTAGIITRDDLLTTDSAVLAKLEAALAGDGHLRTLWDRMNDRVPVELCEDEDALEVRCKSRIVDPPFRDRDGKLVALSEADPHWRSVVQDGMQPKRYRFRFAAAAAEAGR
jgi:uncharacterized protein